MLIFGGKPQTHRECRAVKLYPDEDIAEIVRAASVEAHPDFGHQVRIWAVIVLGMIDQQDRRTRQYGSERRKTARVQKEATAARGALLDLQRALENASKACLELPRAAEEAMRRERWLGPETLRSDLEDGLVQAKVAIERLQVQDGPQSANVLNEAITLLMALCETTFGRQIPASKSGWFVTIASRLLEPLFYADDPDVNGLDSRIMRIAAART